MTDDRRGSRDGPTPPAPKAGVTSLGSPSFSISFLKTNELEKYLVVARCWEMWLRMRGVPRIFPIAEQLRKCSDRFPHLRGSAAIKQSLVQLPEIAKPASCGDPRQHDREHLFPTL